MVLIRQKKKLKAYIEELRLVIDTNFFICPNLNENYSQNPYNELDNKIYN